MRILVTGANGFLGTHLVRALSGMADINVLTYVRGDEPSSLYAKLTESDFIFHLAGVNRPKNKDDFLSSNVKLTADIVNFLYKNKIKSPVYFSSSIHAALPNEYGSSKLACEILLSKLQEGNGNQVFINKLTRVFGPGARPNYNSVVATFCHNVIRDIPLNIEDENKIISMIYVDDLISSMIRYFSDLPRINEPDVYEITLGNLAKIICNFKNKESVFLGGEIEFIQKLHTTYLSHKTLFENC